LKSLIDFFEGWGWGQGAEPPVRLWDHGSVRLGEEGFQNPPKRRDPYSTPLPNKIIVKLLDLAIFQYIHYGVKELYVHNAKQLFRNQTSAKEHAKENGYFFGRGNTK
jgi:hypothetical protein